MLFVEAQQIKAQVMVIAFWPGSRGMPAQTAIK
jgi:hypothetical protein